MDYLMRGVLRGCFKYESLIDGTMSLSDVALVCEALDVQAENERRHHEANKS